MIIDFHTHAFPDKIAQKTVDFLKTKSKTTPYTDGSIGDLSKKSRESGVDLSVVLPVITNPLSTEKINDFAASVNENTSTTGVFSFGGIHPDSPDVKAAIKHIKELGLKGFKIHPAYQQVKLNDLRFKRIFGFAEEYGLIVISHGGYDIGVEGNWSSPVFAAEICSEIHPSRFVMAHMGGWEMWEDVKKYLCGTNIYFDTSFSCVNFSYEKETPQEEQKPVLSENDFLSIIRAHGYNKILFGTDSPWGEQQEQLNFIRNLPLKQEEKAAILGDNAAKLLNI